MKRKKKHGQKRKKQNLYWREKAPVKAPKKHIKLPDKKVLKWAGISLCAVIVIILGCIFVPKWLYKDPVDMKEYIQLSASGKNGEGVLSYNENTLYLSEIMGLTDENAAEFYTDDILSRIEAMSTYQLDVSKDSGLSNNDVISVKVSFLGNAASKAKFKPLNTEFTYVVNGLEE